MNLHGEVIEDLGGPGGHTHHRADPRDLEGKTVAKFRPDADNVWKLYFTDGTSVTIEAEVVGPYLLPVMSLCARCAQ